MKKIKGRKKNENGSKKMRERKKGASSPELVS
jgi:hypothetical protein